MISADIEKLKIIKKIHKAKIPKIRLPEPTDKCKNCRFRCGDRPCVMPKGVCRL